ncbi:hypothetical protein TRSC58_07382 [Trypanosoma rangeli SC58]|uniref:Uncharacterized protein n=1 Tax=Trypanosoma rangeli SC58 TaxID=429131 RepID=A0A061IRM8_TRYRA|nr:hypothetical protein TRSC58_07382 [Trypanosoma rangeli SC58]
MFPKRKGIFFSLSHGQPGFVVVVVSPFFSFWFVTVNPAGTHTPSLSLAPSPSLPYRSLPPPASLHSRQTSCNTHY